MIGLQKHMRYVVEEHIRQMEHYILDGVKLITINVELVYTKNGKEWFRDEGDFNGVIGQATSSSTVKPIDDRDMIKKIVPYTAGFTSKFPYDTTYEVVYEGGRNFFELSDELKVRLFRHVAHVNVLPDPLKQAVALNPSKLLEWAEEYRKISALFPPPDPKPLGKISGEVFIVSKTTEK